MKNSKILFIGIFAMSISTGCVDKYKDTKKKWRIIY